MKIISNRFSPKNALITLRGLYEDLEAINVSMATLTILQEICIFVCRSKISLLSNYALAVTRHFLCILLRASRDLLHSPRRNYLLVLVVYLQTVLYIDFFCFTGTLEILSHLHHTHTLA